MPLPKSSTPVYELELPSIKKKIKYRPFLVKEEKVLIMALESQDMKQITGAVKNVLSSCILSRGVKVENLSTFAKCNLVSFFAIIIYYKLYIGRLDYRLYN